MLTLAADVFGVQEIAELIVGYLDSCAPWAPPGRYGTVTDRGTNTFSSSRVV